MTLTNVTFDLTQNAPKAASTGYTRTIREGLKEEAYVKFREVFVKKVIKTPLSSNLQVSSYKALEMDNVENFFHAISGFTHTSLHMEAWMWTHFVKNVFVIQEIQVTNATANPPTRGVVEVSDLFKIWNTCCDVLTPHLGRAVSAVNGELYVGFPRKSVLKEMQFVEKNNLWDITQARLSSVRRQAWQLYSMSKRGRPL